MNRSPEIADSTADRYQRAIKNYLAWVEEHDLNPFNINTATLKRHFEDLDAEGYSPKYLGVRRGAVGRFYTVARELVEDQTVDVFNDVGEVSDPTEGLDLSRFETHQTRYQEQFDTQTVEGSPVNYLTDEEMQALYEHAIEPVTRNQLIIGILYQTGLRASELVSIKLDAIDERENRITVWSSKSDEERVVWYQPNLSGLMRRWLRIERQSYPHANDNPYLFVSNDGGKLSTKRLNAIIKKSAEQAGIQEELGEDQAGRTWYRVRTHTLRHTFAREAIKGGMSTKQVQDILGHSSIETTETYLETIESDKREAMRKRGPGGGLI